MLVSIVIPCYNSEKTIGKVVELAVEEFRKLEGYECEFVLVNDYSRDDTWGSVHALTQKYPNVKGINLAEFWSAQRDHGGTELYGGRSDHWNGR